MPAEPCWGKSRLTALHATQFFEQQKIPMSTFQNFGQLVLVHPFALHGPEHPCFTQVNESGTSCCDRIPRAKGKLVCPIILKNIDAEKKRNALLSCPGSRLLFCPCQAVANGTCHARHAPQEVARKKGQKTFAPYPLL